MKDLPASPIKRKVGQENQQDMILSAKSDTN